MIALGVPARVAAALLSLGAISALSFARPTAPKPHVSLCISRSAPSRTAHAQLDETLLGAAILSLSSDDCTRLSDLLDTANVRWEARANPLLEDLGAGDPDEDLEASLARAPAPLTTALAAARETYCAADGFCVAVAEDNHACPAGFEPAAGGDERARFLAWPFGYALRLRAESAEEAKRAADILRDRARSSARIGLVLQGGDAEHATEAPFADLRARFVRHEALKRAAESREGNARRENESGAFPVHLDARDILVLPRVEALPFERELSAEIRDVVPSLSEPRRLL